MCCRIQNLNGVLSDSLDRNKWGNLHSPEVTKTDMILLPVAIYIYSLSVQLQVQKIIFIFAFLWNGKGGNYLSSKRLELSGNWRLTHCDRKTIFILYQERNGKQTATNYITKTCKWNVFNPIYVWEFLIQVIEVNVFLVLSKDESYCFVQYSANTSGLQLCAKSITKLFPDQPGSSCSWTVPTLFFHAHFRHHLESTSHSRIICQCDLPSCSGKQAA